MLSYTQPVRRRKYVRCNISDGFKSSYEFSTLYIGIYINSINFHYSASNLLIDRSLLSRNKVMVGEPAVGPKEQHVAEWLMR